MITKLSDPTKKFTSYLIEVLEVVVEIKGELYIFLLQISKCSKFAEFCCNDGWSQ